MSRSAEPSQKKHKTEHNAEHKDQPSAYVACLRARKLFTHKDGMSLEDHLVANIPTLRELMKQLRVDCGSVLAELGSSPATSGRAALRLAALVDGAYMELFCADRLKGNSSVPEPHKYLSKFVTGGKPVECTECGSALAPAPLLCQACTAQNPQLAYLRLRVAEAQQQCLDLPRLTACALAVERLSPGPPGGTMRGSDPLGCETLRQWHAAVRVRVCAWSAFACPSATAAKELVKFCSGGQEIHEVGAGTGYWASYLKKRGLKVVATDSRPVDGTKAQNEYHSRMPSWSAVAKAEAVQAATAAGRARAVLFLCYPPPTDMGAQAVAAFERAGGLSLAIVGEMRGDTGSAELEARLFQGWALAAPPLTLPAYGDTVACLSLWRRKSEQSAPRDREEIHEEEGKNEPQHVRVDITGSEGSPAIVTIRTLKGDAVGSAETRSVLAAAKSRPTPREDVVKAVGLLGDTIFLLDPKDVRVLLAEGLFVSLAEIKAARRDAVRALSSSSSSSSSSSNSSSVQVSWPLACAACSKAPSPAVPMLRDRLTRAVVACSADCSRHPVTLTALDAQLALRHLPSLRVWRDAGAGGANMLWKTAPLL